MATSDSIVVRPSFALGMYLTTIFCLFVTNLEIFLSQRGLLPFNTMFLFFFAVVALSVSVTLSNNVDNYLKQYFESIGRTFVPIFFLLLWLLGHLLFLGETQLDVGDVDYARLFPVYHLGVLMFALALPVAPGFDGALAVAVRATILVLGSSILVDVAYPGFLSVLANRGAGFAMNANVSAFILCLMIALVGMFKRVRLLDGLIVGFGCLAVFFTFSRSGLAQLAIIFLVYGAFCLVRALRARRLGALVKLGVLVVGLTAMVGSLDQIVRSTPIFEVDGVPARVDKLLFKDDGSIAEDKYRPVLNAHYLGLAMARPFSGYGTYYTDGIGAAQAPFGKGPHNIYLRVWVEHGLWGLISYTGFLVSAMWLLVQRRCLPGQIVVLIAALYGFFDHSIIDNKAFMIVLGILLGRSALNAWRRPSATERRR